MISDRISKAYKWIQIVSLDVVIGSALLNLAVAKYYEVSLSIPIVLSLMAAVWIIYTFDHLSDARKNKKVAASIRHRYHQKHFKSISIILFLVLIGSIPLVLLLPITLVKWGILSLVLIAFYFLLLRLKTFWFKEFFVSIIYTLGVFLAPISLRDQTLDPFQALLIPQILILALINLLMFSYFDYKADKQDGHYSFPLNFGLSLTKKLTIGLIIVGLGFCLVTFFLAEIATTQDLQILLFTMNLVLLVILMKENSFSENNLYRVLGDGIFFIPSIFLFLN